MGVATIQNVSLSQNMSLLTIYVKSVEALWQNELLEKKRFMSVLMLNANTKGFINGKDKK